MTVMLRAVLIVVSVLLTFFVIKRIRQSRVKIEDAIFWVMVSFLLVILSLFPDLAYFLSRLAGTQSAANFLFLFVIFLLLVKVFSLSLKLSQLESRVTELVELLALEKAEGREKKEAADESDIQHPKVEHPE